MHVCAPYMHMCVPYTQVYRAHHHMHEVNGLMLAMHIMVKKACGPLGRVAFQVRVEAPPPDA